MGPKKNTVEQQVTDLEAVLRNRGPGLNGRRHGRR